MHLFFKKKYFSCFLFYFYILFTFKPSHTSTHNLCKSYFFRLTSNCFVLRSPLKWNYEEMMTKWRDYHYRNLNNKIITRLSPHIIETKHGGNYVRLCPKPATWHGAERPLWGIHTFDFLHLCIFRAQSNHKRPSAFSQPTNLSQIIFLRSKTCFLWLR